MTRRRPFAAAALTALLGIAVVYRAAPEAQRPAPGATIDRDLLDVSVPQLQRLYLEKKYTVTQVVQWHLDRIDRYNGVYGAIETVFRSEALAEAARRDTEAARGGAVARGALWGVPIVIKANTSIRGQVTTSGWEGFTRPGHALVAPQDATVVVKFKAAGAIIVGHANMPDLAASDTNRSSSFGRTGNAYNFRVSPGGSSGGIVTAVAANMAVLGNGTDTGNSIRMPAATSALVGVFPTRGLVSVAGITPLDWLLDNTGPIARTTTDAAIALTVMAGEDPQDPRTAGSSKSAQRPPYQPYLKAGALRNKRFGVPAFVLDGDGVPFRGIPADVPESMAERFRAAASTPLRPETREMFMKAVDALRAAGAEVVFDKGILPAGFAKTASRVTTYPYIQDGMNRFLATFGPAEYHSAADYLRVMGRSLYPTSIGAENPFANLGLRIDQRQLDRDPDAERSYYAPRRAMLAAYLEPLDRLKLDGYVYPAIQMPPPDETLPGGRVSDGPHSDTNWVNIIGVPAVVVPAGFYATGLPFGLELSARPWTDGDLLAIAYAWEQATRLRRSPTLVERSPFPLTPARESGIQRSPGPN